MTNVGLPSTQVFHSVGDVDSYLCTADGSIHAPFTNLVAYDTRATAGVTGGPAPAVFPRSGAWADGRVHGSDREEDGLADGWRLRDYGGQGTCCNNPVVCRSDKEP